MPASSESDGEKLPNQKYIRLKSFRGKSFYWNNFSFATIHCRSSAVSADSGKHPAPIGDEHASDFSGSAMFRNERFSRRPFFDLVAHVFSQLNRSRPITRLRQVDPLFTRIAVTVSNRCKNFTFNFRLHICNEVLIIYSAIVFP